MEIKRIKQLDTKMFKTVFNINTYFLKNMFIITQSF